MPASIAFYSKMFAAEPTRVESDYAKWMLDDPRVNFAISTRGGKPGVDHLGIQTETEEELAELKSSATAADMSLLDEGETTCCYARSDKHWLIDPQGIAWEHFRSLDNIPVFSEKPTQASDASACCVTPTASAAPAVRGKPIAIPVKPASSCC
jgi:lactoylglutathione lyase